MTGPPDPDRRLRVFLVNWQDRENPQAGGAEVHLHEIFGRLASRGHEVRALVGGWPGCAPETRLDGIRIRRVGGRHGFALRARAAGIRALREAPADVVVEDINKLPLFVPTWTAAPVVALVPHLFGTTAFREAAWPVAAAVWGAERLIPRVYRGCPFEAISDSTADDLAGRGIPRERIRVIPPGIDHAVYAPDPSVARAPEPTILYVGRLKRYKGLDVLVDAVARVRGTGVDARLVVVGRGDDRPRLEALVRERGLTGAVRFPGFVSEAEKVAWLRRAWVLAYPSPKEGWGIANVEAAACGTPVVASDSPGLRESVAPGRSGLLVPHGDPAAWADALGRILRDESLRARLGRDAIDHAAMFSWDRAAEDTETHLVEVAARDAAMGPTSTG